MNEQFNMPQIVPDEKRAGWQLHPSTHTAHFFAQGAGKSMCRRETRVNDGAVVSEPGTFPCSLCQARMAKGLF
jgi:hypothetical protein